MTQLPNPAETHDDTAGKAPEEPLPSAAARGFMDSLRHPPEAEAPATGEQATAEPPWPRTEAVRRLLGRDPAKAGAGGQPAQMSAGGLAADAIAAATGSERPGGLDGLGKSVADPEHLLAVVEEQWDRKRLAEIDVAAVAIGLALDGVVGRILLRTGLIQECSTARLADGGETYWDALSDEGRTRAENQPLLAAALGAPAERTVHFPGPTRLIAFSPYGDRVAVLGEAGLFRAERDGEVGRVGGPDAEAISLGWDYDGILVLRNDSAGLHLHRPEQGNPADNDPPSGITEPAEGLLAGGPPAWLARTSGVTRWWGRGGPAEDVVLPGATEVLAVDDTGHRGLLRVGEDAVLVSTLPADRLRFPPTIDPARNDPPTNDHPTNDPPTNDPAVTLARIPFPEGPYALVDLGDAVAVAEVTEDDRIVVSEPGGPPIAEILTGGRPVDAIATGGAGNYLAVAFGDQVEVWPIATVVSRSVAGYDPDSMHGTDLLEADRDAVALAALIASRRLRPPLAVGLFGEWGSGKTFVLDRIIGTLRELAGSHDDGFVNDVVDVPFNAWHYAETNLWASLVDAVLRKVAPRPAADLPEVQEAQRLVAEADTEQERLAGEESKALAAVTTATERLVKRRRNAWITGGVVVLGGAAAVVTVVLGGSAMAATVLSAATVVAGYLTTALGQVKAARSQAAEIAATGQAGLAAATRFSTRADADAARAAVAHHEEVAEQARAAHSAHERLVARAQQLTEQAGDDRMASVVGQLSTVSEYRDQLSLVTRTRDRFKALDKQFAAQGRRVVIAIDDLDRCEATKVVQVLEAVHLLFNFEMFVVVLAVDTRWLEQSLRIRYAQLLGVDSAHPSDYLEKIIQVPMRLVPLGDDLVRRMIAGLTGVAGHRPEPAPAPAKVEPAAAGRPVAHDEGGSADVAELRTAPRAGRTPRLARGRPPAEHLETTPDEGAAMADVAPLVGSTPRTVKRFVNTYRLLKARVRDLDNFDHPREGVGDHEVVAFLLAVVTGQPAEAAKQLFDTLRREPAGPLCTAVAPNRPELDAVRLWLAANPRYGNAPRHRFAAWAPEVARFSF
ncbi:P-loop NTPase fold protein [Actinoplanes sp. NPDC026619]|uniref:KAP family P-loop NTPase fold protein n=1 Tax=Actinoplanes sp. NPDC026619 TaxID=3155798 RepID=UPI00340C85F3